MNTIEAYIIAEDLHTGVHLANFLNKNGNKAIISEENESDYRAQLKDLVSNNQDSDLNIIITSKPAVLTIEANKLDGIRAVLCKTADDLDAIDEAGVNTVLLDSSFDDEKLCSMFEKYNYAPSAERRPQPQKPVLQSLKQTYANAQTRQKAQKKSANPASNENGQKDGQKEPFWNPQKGVKKNLKDIFGIE